MMNSTTEAISSKQLTRYDTDRDGDEYATDTGPYVHYTDAQAEIERLSRQVGLLQKSRDEYYEAYWKLKNSGHETKPQARDAEHCDYPDCEQHNTLVVMRLQAALDFVLRERITLHDGAFFQRAEVNHPDPRCGWYSFPSMPDQISSDLRQSRDRLAQKAGVAQRIYRHLKTGNAYEVLFDAFDATNAREGQGAVVYRRIGHTAVYVRDASEFHEKFVSTGESSEKAAPKHAATCSSRYPYLSEADPDQGKCDCGLNGRP